MRKLPVAVLSILMFGPAMAYEPAPPHPTVAPEELAATLHDSLKSTRVVIPGGGNRLVAGAEGEGAILTPDRTTACMETVEEASGWPDAWLVVQEASLDHDIVMLLRLAGNGDRVEAATVFATPRREWDGKTLRNAVREATGRKPEAKFRNIVVQGFSRREVTSYVYETPPAGEKARGLLALLPDGSVVREARTVDLGDERLHTLAVALIRPSFLPADCRSCRGREFGHADTGGVLVVLAGEEGTEDVLELTGRLQVHDGGPLVPRFPCREEDAGVAVDGETVGRWMRERTAVRLLALEDLDGDGHELEFTLAAAYEECRRPRNLVVAVDPATATLRVLD